MVFWPFSSCVQQRRGLSGLRRDGRQSLSHDVSAALSGLTQGEFALRKHWETILVPISTNQDSIREVIVTPISLNVSFPNDPPPCAKITTVTSLIIISTFASSSDRSGHSNCTYFARHLLWKHPGLLRFTNRKPFNWHWKLEFSGRTKSTSATLMKFSSGSVWRARYKILVL